jgi:hypothetical protein
MWRASNTHEQNATQSSERASLSVAILAQGIYLKPSATSSSPLDVISNMLAEKDQFMKQASNAERAKHLAPILIDMISDFDNSNATDGVDAFQATVLKLIEQYGFIDHVDMHADKLGVHPDNRETAGLVAIDVHDLLLRIVHIGWNWSKVDILAAQIPPTEEGQRWRDFSVKVGASSDGLLAAVKPDELEACTGRGSHTTASVRCMLHGVPGIHEELCMDGNISLAKILETRPSMNEPIRKGLPVTRIKWEICAAVPQLMEMLSRSGNTSHSLRPPTPLRPHPPTPTPPAIPSRSPTAGPTSPPSAAP